MSTLPASSTQANTSASGLHSRAILFVLLGLLVGLVLVPIFLAEQSHPWEILLCMLLGVIILAPLIHRTLFGRFDLFEPIVIIAVIYLLYFVISPMLTYINGVGVYLKQYLWQRSITVSLERTICIIAIGKNTRSPGKCVLSGDRA